MRRTMTLLVVCAVAATISPAAFAATYSGTFHTGTNYFSLPAIASSMDPNVVFAGVPITPDKLFFWCRLTQHWYAYPDAEHFTSMLWHMAYRYEADQDYTYNFAGSQPTNLRSTCMNPASAGFAFISQPYDHASFWSGFQFSCYQEGDVKVSAAQAAANGWIEPYLIAGDRDSGVHITFDGAGGTSTIVEPGQGYWVTTKVAPDTKKITIYWPTQPVPEPGSLLALAAGIASAAGIAIRRRRA